MARAKCSLVSIHGGQSSRTWHKSAVQLLGLSTSICLVMIICFSISSSRGGAIEITKLFSGKCSHTDNINRALQAVLALLAIGISVSFDFFMRLVSSPTIDDLREAHSQGRSLDVAIHSFRNVRHISHWRTFAWVTLILLAVPIQLFSHSIAFVSVSTEGYTKVSISEACTTGQNFTSPGVALMRSLPTNRERSQFQDIPPDLESASTEWDKLEASDCGHIYSQDIERLKSHRNILVVMEAGPDADAKEGTIAAEVRNDTTLHAHDDNDSELKDSLWSFVVYEIGRYMKCRLSYDNSDGLYPCATESRVKITVRDALDFSPVYDVIPPPCIVYVSNFFLMVTILCIILGCTCSAFVARFCWHKETCQSLGDALQVFLEEGETLVQMPGTLPAGCNSEGTAPPSTRWTPVSKWEEARPRWGQAISKSMWLGTYVPIAALLLGGSAALAALRQSIPQVPNRLLC